MTQGPIQLEQCQRTKSQQLSLTGFVGFILITELGDTTLKRKCAPMKLAEVGCKGQKIDEESKKIKHKTKAWPGCLSVAHAGLGLNVYTRMASNS